MEKFRKNEGAQKCYSSPRIWTQIFEEPNAKKVGHKLTSKKVTDIQADTLGMKKWENVSLIIIT